MNHLSTTESEQRPNRAVLVPVSIIFLTLPIQMLGMSAGDNWTALIFPLSVYVAFLILVGTIQTLLAMRLYEMHELRRFVFDIPTWFLMASLLACPLAGANFVVYWVFRMEVSDSVESLTTVRWITVVVLFFLLLPIFYLTEALLAAFNRLSGDRNSRS